MSSSELLTRVAAECRRGDVSTVRRLRNNDEAAMIAAALRRECDAMAERRKPRLAEFPRLSASKRRIRATVVSTMPTDGNIAGAPNFDGDLRASAAVFAAANAAPVVSEEPCFVTPKKRPRRLQSSTTTAKKITREKSLSDECICELAALFAGVVAKGGGGPDVALGAVLKMLCRVLDRGGEDDEEEEDDDLLLRRCPRATLRFAAVVAAMLRKFVVAIGGRTAAEGLANGCVGTDSLMRTARDALEAVATRCAQPPEEKKSTTAPTTTTSGSGGVDVAMPFVKARDSRHEFEVDQSERNAYNNREKCRDAFLALLRDFRKAQADVDGRALMAFVPNEDQPYFHGFGGRREPTKPTKGKKKPYENETLRGRSSRLVRSLLPENVAWFADLFDATLVQTSATSAPPEVKGDTEKLRKLEARIYESAAGDTAGEDPASLFDHGETFFYLLIAGADAARLETKLLDTLARHVAADLGGDRLDRLILRAKLAGVVLCLSTFGRDLATTDDGGSRPWPRALCPVRLLGDETFTTSAGAIKVLVVSQLCRALRWDRSFRSAPPGTFYGELQRTLLEAQKRLATATSVGPCASALICARLELDRLIYDDLQLSPLEEDDRHQATIDVDIFGAFLDVPPMVTPLVPRTVRRGGTPVSGGTLSGEDLALSSVSRVARDVGRQCAAVGRQGAVAPQSTVKLRPYLVRPPTVDPEDQRRRLFAPVAASFFRRYPTIQAAVDLAIDAAKAHVEHALDDDDVTDAYALAKDLLVARLGPALDLAAPPEMADRVTAVATNLALAHWSNDVLPGLLQRRSRRTKVV